jgi:hypothetical protein
MLHTLRAFLAGAVLGLLALFQGRVPAQATDEKAEKPWEVVRIGTGAVAVPKGWRSIRTLPPRMVLYRQGDGIGVPATDETGSPLQIGMTVEKYPNTKQSPAEGARALLEAVKKNPRFELVGKEKVEDLKLADGSEARLLTTELIKDKERRSLQMKLLVKDADSNGWVISGFIVGGKASKLPTPGSDLAQWLRAHLASFCLNADKLDEAKLKEAYKRRGQ